MTEHDPRNIQMGQWALQRGWLSREQCRSFLEEATAQGTSIAEIALYRRVLNSQQAQTLLQHSGWSQSGNNAPIAPSSMLGSGSGSREDSRHPRTPTSSFRKATQSLPEIGEDVEGYEILSLLGKGGMGAVFKARGPSGSEFALKFILHGSEKAMARFEREAQAVAAVDTHPNIVSIHKLSRHGSYSYIVLDYVEGQAMDGLLKETETEHADAALIWVGKIATALRTVHSRGITHRDIKPANVLIQKDSGEPLLTDFGLAKMDDGQQLTHSREVLGTPHYMAPEQAGTEKDRIGPGSDIWALGVILYQACTGQLPFQGNTVVELATAIMFAQPELPRSINPDLSIDVETIILKCLEKEVENRYESCAVLASDCFSASRSEAISTSRPGVRGAVTRRWIQRHQKLLSLFLVSTALLVSATFVIKDVLDVGDKQTKKWSEETSGLLEKVKLNYQRVSKAQNRHLESHVWGLFEKSWEPGPDCKTVGQFQRSVDELEAQLARMDSRETKDRIVPPRLLSKLLGEVSFLRSIETGSPTKEVKELSKKAPFCYAADRMRARDWDAAEKHLESSHKKARSLRVIVQLSRAFIAKERGQWAELEDVIATIPDDAGLSRGVRDLRQSALEQRVLSALMARTLIDKTALIQRLRSYYQKTRRKTEGAWIHWNEKVQGKFDLGSKFPGGLLALAKVYESLGRLHSVFPELRLPRLSTSLQSNLAERAQNSGRISEALYHYLELKRRNPDFKAPKGFRSGELDSLMLNSMASGGIQGMKDAYRILLAASRAGWYLSALPEDYLGRLHDAGFLNTFINSAPGDPCARFWRGMIPVDFSLEKKGKLEELILFVDERIGDLNFALSKESFQGSLRAQALFQKAWLVRERPEEGAEKRRKRKSMKLVLEAMTHHPTKPDEFLLRLANWTSGSKLQLKLQYLKRSETIMADRFQRTIDGRLNEGRPPQYGLHPIFAELEASRRAQINNKRAEIYLAMKDYKKAMVAAQSSLNAEDNATGHIVIGRVWIAQGRLDKAKERYAIGMKRFPNHMWKLKDDIKKVERQK